MANIDQDAENIGLANDCINLHLFIGLYFVPWFFAGAVAAAK